MTDPVIVEAWQRAETRARAELDRRIYGGALLSKLLAPLRHGLDLLIGLLARFLAWASALVQAILVVVLAYFVGQWLGHLIGIPLGGVLLSIVALLAWRRYTRGDRLRDRL